MGLNLSLSQQEINEISDWSKRIRVSVSQMRESDENSREDPSNYFGRTHFMLWHDSISKSEYIKVLLRKIDYDPKQRDLDVFFSDPTSNFSRFEYLMSEFSNITGFNFSNNWELPVAELKYSGIYEHGKVVSRDEIRDIGTQVENLGFQTIGFSYSWIDGLSSGPNKEFVYASPEQLEKIKKGSEFKHIYLNNLDRQIRNLEQPVKREESSYSREEPRNLLKFLKRA